MVWVIDSKGYAVLAPRKAFTLKTGKKRKRRKNKSRLVPTGTGRWFKCSARGCGCTTRLGKVDYRQYLAGEVITKECLFCGRDATARLNN